MYVLLGASRSAAPPTSSSTRVVSLNLKPAHASGWPNFQTRNHAQAIPMAEKQPYSMLLQPHAIARLYFWVFFPGFLFGPLPLGMPVETRQDSPEFQILRMAVVKHIQLPQSADRAHIFDSSKLARLVVTSTLSHKSIPTKSNRLSSFIYIHL